VDFGRRGKTQQDFATKEESGWKKQHLKNRFNGKPSHKKNGGKKILYNREKIELKRENKRNPPNRVEVRQVRSNGL